MNSDTKFKLASIGVWLTGVVVSLSFATAVLYVAIHFIKKVW